MKRKRAAGGSRAAGGKMGSRARRSAVCSMGQLRAAKEKSGLAPAMAKEARRPGAGAGATRGRAAKQSADKAPTARDGASLREIERLLHLGQNQIIPKTRGCVQPGSLQETSSPRPAAEGKERERRADESAAGLAGRAVAAATAGGRPALATGGAARSGSWGSARHGRQRRQRLPKSRRHELPAAERLQLGPALQQAPRRGTAELRNLRARTSWNRRDLRPLAGVRPGPCVLDRARAALGRRLARRLSAGGGGCGKPRPQPATGSERAGGPCGL